MNELVNATTARQHRTSSTRWTQSATCEICETAGKKNLFVMEMFAVEVVAVAALVVTTLDPTAAATLLKVVV